MRQGLGLFLVGMGAVFNAIFTILLFAGALTGIWWPLTLVIIDNPVSALWWVPLGFFLTGLSFAILHFIYDLIIGFPLVWLATWLVDDRN